MCEESFFEKCYSVSMLILCSSNASGAFERSKTFVSLIAVSVSLGSFSLHISLQGTFGPFPARATTSTGGERMTKTMTGLPVAPLTEGDQDGSRTSATVAAILVLL